MAIKTELRRLENGAPDWPWLYRQVKAASNEFLGQGMLMLIYEAGLSDACDHDWQEYEHLINKGSGAPTKICKKCSAVQTSLEKDDA